MLFCHDTIGFETETKLSDAILCRSLALGSCVLTGFPLSSHRIQDAFVEALLPVEHPSTEPKKKMCIEGSHFHSKLLFCIKKCFFEKISHKVLIFFTFYIKI